MVSLDVTEKNELKISYLAQLEVEIAFWGTGRAQGVSPLKLKVPVLGLYSQMYFK